MSNTPPPPEGPKEAGLLKPALQPESVWLAAYPEEFTQDVEYWPLSATFAAD